MTQVVFHNVMMLALLSALPFLAVLYLYADHRRKKALKRFVAAMMLPQLTDCPTDRRRRWKAIALCGAFVFVVIALSRPAWNPTETQLARAGRDIVFVLDVSRSMLAEDLAPNRLDRAKRAILDCLEDLKGDRVGLVAFAGSASIISPLTHDYQFFRSVLTDVTCDSVTVGGTRIGDAIFKVADDMLADTKAGFQDIILITDGEDHDSEPTAAAEELKLKGARLIAIGLGDEYQGRRIPVTDDETGQTSFMKYENQEVWSRMDPKALRQLISTVPESVLFKVGTGTIDLAGIYQQLIVTARNRQYEGETNIRYEEKFQIFVAIAILLLLLRAPMGQRTCHENTRQPDDTSENAQASPVPKTAAAYLLA
ncbi:MAG: VWA domain-containing protein, partial [Planctomycetes bacterium]|nr:VWA domain-containing protein [Planctomycetota bacterium]